MRILLMISALAVVVSSLPALSAEDGFKVKDSNVISLKLDQVLPKGSRLKLPDGGRVTLYDIGQNEIRICVGAYDGQVEDCKGDQTCPWWKILGCRQVKDLRVGGGRGPDDEVAPDALPNKK